jgi:tRNA nucleotidyltransferase/poly(A) polymerase
MERNEAILDSIKRLDAVWTVLHNLENVGFEAYLVGGCVRDMLLGKTPNDYDIATNALPEEVQSIFSRTIPTGIRHGTVSVLQNGERIEVTTYRREKGYRDARRPEEVEFIASLEKDLARRDFTINAIAMDRQGKVYDPFYGKSDLLERRIRTVGNPAERFQEDALRMLRGIRLATVLDGQIESSTWEAICLYADRMIMISRERIRDEWNKILLSDVKTGMQWLIRSTLLGSIFPRLQEIDTEIWLRAGDCSNRLSEQADIRQAALFWRLGIDRHVAASVLRDLRQSKALIRSVLAIMEAIPETDPLAWTEATWAAYLFQYGQDPVFRALQVVGRAHPEREDALIARFHQASAVQPLWSSAELPVSGQDLIDKLNIPPGPVVGQLLDRLVQAVLREPALCSREALLAQAAVEYRRQESNPRQDDGR